MRCSIQFILIVAAASLLGLPNAGAQYVLDSVPETPDVGALRQYRNQLKVSPIRILDPFNPGFELSYERHFSKRFSTQLSMALLKDAFKITGNDDYKGYRVALEEKYFVTNTKRFRPYVSLDVVYHWIRIRRQDDFTPFPDGYYTVNDTMATDIYTDDYRIEKKMLTINGKVGLQVLLGRVVLDLGYGLGIKFKQIAHFDRTDPSDHFVQGVDLNIWTIPIEQGNFTTLNMPLNFKVGYLF